MQKLLLISVIDQYAGVVIKKPLKISDKNVKGTELKGACCTHLSHWNRMLYNPNAGVEYCWLNVLPPHLNRVTKFTVGEII